MHVLYNQFTKTKERVLAVNTRTHTNYIYIDIYTILVLYCNGLYRIICKRQMKRILHKAHETFLAKPPFPQEIIPKYVKYTNNSYIYIYRNNYGNKYMRHIYHVAVALSRCDGV